MVVGQIYYTVLLLSCGRNTTLRWMVMVPSSVMSVGLIITKNADVTFAFVMQCWLSAYTKHGQVIKIILKIEKSYISGLFYFDNFHKKCPDHFGKATGDIVRCNLFLLFLSCFVPIMINFNWTYSNNIYLMLVFQMFFLYTNLFWNKISELQSV